MKATGIIVIVIGIALTIFTGINLVRQEKVVEVGDFQITQDKKHELDWSPWIGVGVVVAGVVILLVGRKR